MSTTFYQGTDWATSQGPRVHRNVADEDLYPHGSGKDALEDGLHPVLAIGGASDTRRVDHKCGVLVTYESESGRAVVNVAQGAIVKAYIANITGYSGGDANAFATSLTIGMPVYIDDSDDLPAGVTLSLCPTNDADASNPLAGYLWYDQTEDVDPLGANSDAWPKTVAEELVISTLNIMLA